MAAEIERIVAKRFPDEDNKTKIGALMHATAVHISTECGHMANPRATIERFGRAFDEIVLMQLSKHGTTEQTEARANAGSMSGGAVDVADAIARTS